MEDNDGKFVIASKETISTIFSDFLTRVTKFEELVAVGSKLLDDFSQGLEFLRRSPINTKSELVEKILKVNETNRVKSYVQAGCINACDGVQNVSKLHTSLCGLRDHLSKAKCILSELECLMEDVAGELHSANENLSPPWGEESGDVLDLQATTSDEIGEEKVLSHPSKPETTDYAALMAIIYSMLKQDYSMQERMVNSLNHNSSSGELESYSLMWSLRPFINDEIMHQAWKLIP
ncbi:uncharacterized protein LOC131150619 isoform X1 [Malania oleifera]|uniref:uncharacterized protein LOC131150619 isoform X1 n=1 Tax=Malania oleifera TaxID=397392 RepID=UPI0025AE2341|nr:uncharacterized protein LOC131150619 isoform X1 [Malania oleifera]